MDMIMHKTGLQRAPLAWRGGTHLAEDASDDNGVAGLSIKIMREFLSQKVPVRS